MKTVKQLIYEGRTAEAIRILDEQIRLHPTDDEAFFLRGNAYRKAGETRLSLNDYLRAIELNPDSPARQAYAMQIEILNFYNKDMYNQ
ncbi:MAG: tetratricopeptide repeat protein [Parabacteroides sp.]